MSEFYNKFQSWIKEKYPAESIPINRRFTKLFKQLNIGNYRPKISNLNGNSGLSNRKWKL